MAASTATSTAHWTPADIADQHGRTAFITGGNSGIGLETARVLTAHGARVILAGRSQTKLDEAATELRTTQPDADISTTVVDLGNLASIQQATATIAATETIDLLFNNAGVMNVPERRETSDGFELTFGTNHLGHFALTAGLLPALHRSTAARIITVSAIAATWRSGRLDDLMSEQNYGAMTSYAKSKRANVVFTQELTRRLTGTTIEAITVHPGAAVTNLQQHGQGTLNKIVLAFAQRFLMGSPEGAAWPSLYAATNPDAHSGQFIGPAGRNQTSGTPQPVALPKGADNPTEGAYLWTESERLTGIRFAI